MAADSYIGPDLGSSAIFLINQNLHVLLYGAISPNGDRSHNDSTKMPNKKAGPDLCFYIKVDIIYLFDLPIQKTVNFHQNILTNSTFGNGLRG